ncbi:MAG: hypothetical protein AAGA66_21920 [Bacteroidota bacterium]
MKNSKFIYAVILCFACILPAFAQGPPPATPIDGGLSALLVAGGLYGLKKLRDRRI